MDDDLQVLTLPYSNDLQCLNYSNNLCVLIVLILQCLLTLIHWILSFLIPVEQKSFLFAFFQDPNENFFTSYNIIVYSQLILTSFSLLIRFYLKNRYYHKLRILGYYNHHKQVKKFVLLPTNLLHYSNFLLLFVTVIFDHFKNVHLKNIHFKSIHAAEMIISVFSIMIIINLSVHFYYELKFRKYRNPPDVFCIDDPSRRLTSDGLNQVTIRSSSFLEDLLENQADLIYNLKLQNNHLRELLFKASQTRNGAQQSESIDN